MIKGRGNNNVLNLRVFMKEKLLLDESAGLSQFDQQLRLEFRTDKNEFQSLVDYVINFKRWSPVPWSVLIPTVTLSINSLSPFMSHSR